MNTVLITVDSRGIGREIAIKFAKNGYNVIINYNKSLSKAKSLAKALEKYDVRTLLVKADVSIDSEVNNLVKESLKTFGHIDVLESTLLEQ